jgi:hypothetical protein
MEPSCGGNNTYYEDQEGSSRIGMQNPGSSASHCLSEVFIILISKTISDE